MVDLFFCHIYWCLTCSQVCPVHSFSLYRWALMQLLQITVTVCSTVKFSLEFYVFFRLCLKLFPLFVLNNSSSGILRTLGCVPCPLLHWGRQFWSGLIDCGNSDGWSICHSEATPQDQGVCSAVHVLLLKLECIPNSSWKACMRHFSWIDLWCRNCELTHSFVCFVPSSCLTDSKRNPFAFLKCMVLVAALRCLEPLGLLCLSGRSPPRCLEPR